MVKASKHRNSAHTGCARVLSSLALLEIDSRVRDFAGKSREEVLAEMPAELKAPEGYAPGRTMAEYLTELPPREVLQERFHRAIAVARDRLVSAATMRDESGAGASGGKSWTSKSPSKRAFPVPRCLGPRGVSADDRPRL